MKDLSKILWAIIIFFSCFIACDNVDDKENDNQKPNEETHTGTENDPYLVADIIAKKPQSTIEAVESDVWVEGYIVGYRNDQESPAKDYFGKQDSYLSNNNVYLADNADETNYGKCICVQIVAAFRQEVGLKAVPTNLGKKLSVKGNIMIYHSIPGVKGMSTYRIDGSGPEEPSTPDSGNGTESNPYTVNDIISKDPQSTTEAVESGVWAEGYIVGYRNDQETPSKNYFGKQDSYMSNNNVILASKSDETDINNCICIQVVSTFREKIGLMSVPENLGKKLAVKGNIMKYYSMPGIKGMTDYKIDGVGPTPEPPIEGAILEAKFDTDLCGFTAISVIGDQVWNVNTTYKYVVISGYANKKSNQNEDWLISPAFSLKNVTSANITFTHIINKGDLNNLKTNHTLWISSDYKEGQPSTTTWEQIPITTYPVGNNWNKTESGDIPIPATYIGKDNIRIAFKYICSNSESASWEIMDLVIK